MNELDKALERLRALGATPQEMDAFAKEFMAAQGTPADATRALPRDRESPSGDWEAIPDALKTAAGVGVSMIPAGRGAAVAAKGAMRLAPVAGAVAAELPVLRNVTRAVRAGQRIWRAGKAMEKIQQAPKSLDDIVGNLEILPEAPPTASPAASRALEDVAAGVKPWSPRSAPKARFAHFAQRMAQRQAAEKAQAAEPALEDLLGLSLEHIKQGGSLKSAADALKLVRRQ